MNYKYIFGTLVFLFAVTVNAQMETGVDVGVKVKTNVEQVNVKSQAQVNSTSTMAKNNAEDKGESTSDEHRSAVADVVLKLTAVAGKDRNIGEEIREVARDQATSSQRVVKAMVKIENRNALKTFLIGSDYKNLGALRSEIVTTDNSISRLTKARDRATDPVVKAELDVQIKALQDEKTKIDAFIQLNENKVSLMGWLFRIFNS